VGGQSGGAFLPDFIHPHTLSHAITFSSTTQSQTREGQHIGATPQTKMCNDTGSLPKLRFAHCDQKRFVRPTSRSPEQDGPETSTVSLAPSPTHLRSWSTPCNKSPSQDTARYSSAPVPGRSSDAQRPHKDASASGSFFVPRDTHTHRDANLTTRPYSHTLPNRHKTQSTFVEKQLERRARASGEHPR